MNPSRYLLFLTTVFFSFFLACGSSTPNSGTAQDSETRDSVVASMPDSVHYEIPAELKYDPKDYKDEKDPFRFYVAGHFYPIGWSKDGKFAYAQMMADTTPGSKNQRYEIQIRDMLNDSIVWLITEKISGTSYINLDLNETSVSTIDSVWNVHYDKIRTALWRNNIIPDTITQKKYFGFFPNVDLFTRGGSYDKMGHHPRGHQYWPDVQLWVGSNKSKKEKLFCDHHFGLNGPIWFHEQGYMKDPYSDRLIVLIELYFWGGENNGIQLPMYDVAAVDPTSL